MKSDTTMQKTGERELTSTRVINGPPHLVWKAWTQADLFRRWWVPRSFPVNLVGCELDVREGGTYRLTFEAGGQTMAFFGRYLEVTPNALIKWTNEEGGEANMAITTVTFEAKDGGKTLVTLRDLHPTAEARDEAITGSSSGTPETFDQLEALVATL